MRGRRPALAALDGGLLKAPPPPATLPPGMAEEWRTLAADLQGRGLLTSTVVTVLETYLGAVWMARECRKAILEHGPLVRAKDGQVKPNPAGAMLAKAQETVARLADELVLTPSSKSRPGNRAAAAEMARDEDPFAEFEL